MTAGQQIILTEQAQLVADAEGAVILHIPVLIENREYQHLALDTLAAGRGEHNTLVGLLESAIASAFATYAAHQAGDT